MANPKTARLKHPYVSDSFTAGEDLSAHQHRYVKLDANGNIVKAGVLGEDVLGILLDDPPSGEIGLVALSGIVPVEANAAIDEGVRVTTASNGRATTGLITHTSNARNLDGVGAAGKLISVHLGLRLIEP